MTSLLPQITLFNATVQLPQQSPNMSEMFSIERIQTLIMFMKTFVLGRE